MKQKRKGPPLVQTANGPEISGKRSNPKFSTRQHQAPPRIYAGFRHRGRR